jgi:hypothetical protein
MTRHNADRRLRRLSRPASRRLARCRYRRCLRGRRRGPDDFTQALTAWRRALRAHRRLARLAPSFFDAAVVQRETENRAERRRWMATWAPALAKAYGTAVEPPDPDEDRPQLPPPRIQREADLKLTEVQAWLEAGRVAMDRHQRRRPHELLSLSRMARLLDMGFALKRMACGMDSPNKLPEKITYDYELTDLKRGYGHLFDAAESGIVPSDLSAGSGSGVASSTAPATATPVSGSEARPAVTNLVQPPPAPAMEPPPEYRRCDAWSRLARQMRK